MRNRKAQGFTLIELLIVIAIIGILAAVLIPNLMRARAVAVDRAAEAFASNLVTAATAYMAEDVSISVTDVAGYACSAAGYTAGDYTVNGAGFDLVSCDVTDEGSDVGAWVEYNGGVGGAGAVHRVNTTAGP